MRSRWDDDQFSDPRFKVDYDGLAEMEDAALREWIERILEAESRPGDLIRIVQNGDQVMIAVNGREVGRWP